MEPDLVTPNESVETTTDPIEKKKPRIVIVVIVIVFLLLAIIVWGSVDFFRKGQPSNQTTVNLSGELYFSAIPRNANPKTPAIYQQVLSEGETNLWLDYPSYSFNLSTDGKALVLGASNEGEDPDQVVPLRFVKGNPDSQPQAGINGFGEVDLALSADDRYYAYSYQTNSDMKPFQLSDWNIAVHDSQTGQVKIIKSAAEPEFFHQKSAVAIMRADGVYEHDLMTGEERLMFGKYQGLTMIDDFALAPNDNHLILAIPDRNLISAAVANGSGEAEFTETGFHQESEVKYRHPVISPDGEHYVVAAATQIKPRFNSDIAVTLQFRSVSSHTLVDSLDYDWAAAPSVRPELWLAN